MKLVELVAVPPGVVTVIVPVVTPVGATAVMVVVPEKLVATIMPASGYPHPAKLRECRDPGRRVTQDNPRNALRNGARLASESRANGISEQSNSQAQEPPTRSRGCCPRACGQEARVAGSRAIERGGIAFP